MSYWEIWGRGGISCSDQLGKPPPTAAGQGTSPLQFPLLLLGLLPDGEGGQAQGWPLPLSPALCVLGSAHRRGGGAVVTVWEQEDCILHPEDCISHAWDCFSHPHGMTVSQSSDTAQHSQSPPSQTKAEHGELQRH